MDYNYIKHVHEAPEAVSETLSLGLEDIRELCAKLNVSRFDMIILTGCGSSNNAAICAEYAFRKLLKMPVEVIASSELVLYDDDYLNSKKLVFAISRSGEKGDSLGAAQKAKNAGATVVALTKEGTNLALVSDYIVKTYEGPEYCQPKTKSVIVTILALIIFAICISDSKEKETLLHQLMNIPKLMRQTLDSSEALAKRVADESDDIQGIMLAGAGEYFGAAYEASLKLKETCSIHAESMPTGEIIQGPILIVNSNWRYVAFADGNGIDHAVTMLKAVKKRGAKTIVLSSQPDRVNLYTDYLFQMPAPENPIFASLVYLLPLQLITYYISQRRGLDADFPKDFDQILDVILKPGSKEPEMA
ncbi:MAG: SIS domain-containing protein [Oscillospiraceae bacterium]|nr:SIS domain-containing protein [Oscillospiraceae bacterium]